MRRHDIIFWLFSLCAVVLSCATDDRMSGNADEGRYEFLLSVGHQNGMRMANEVVQATGAFRGIKEWCVIPFTTTEAGAVTVDDDPLISVVIGSGANKVTRQDDEKYYYVEHCSLKEGTNRVLVYGQATPVAGQESSDKNGLLVTGVGDYIVPADIQFSLQSISETDDAEDAVFAPARELAEYLTTIANTAGWNITTDSQMKTLYLDFIHADAEGTGLMAGSAVNVKAYVEALKGQLEEIMNAEGTPDDTKTLCAGIISNIGDIDDDEECVNNGYPGSLGLPDGAAALRWTGSEFSVRTQTSTLDYINGINRYTYPAELWYYANSGIYTSKKEIGEDAYKTKDWETLLSNYDQHDITIETKSVAVGEPLQYGVACLQTTLKAITGELRDSQNEVVADATAANLPLTAVIIGGQHTVGFDFKPQVPKSDVDARFIYDAVVGTTGTVNTLVLQSYDEEKVPVILELENNTGHRFHGKDGIIYPGTKFYLIAQLDPAGMGEGACANRVFTQDYTTKVSMQVTSLANAYSCMPDLLESRLEIGIQVVTEWIQSTTTTVKL